DSLHFADAFWSGPASGVSVCKAAATEGGWRNPGRSGVGSGAHRPVAVGFQADGSDKGSIQGLEFVSWFAFCCGCSSPAPKLSNCSRVKNAKRGGWLTIVGTLIPFVLALGLGPVDRPRA